MRRSLRRSKAKFRDAIGAAIPSLIELLKHDQEDVRSSAVSTLAKLADDGEFHFNMRARYINRTFKAKFRDGLRSAIPSIVKLLKQGGQTLGSSVVSAVGKLSYHGELHLSR